MRQFARTNATAVRVTSGVLVAFVALSSLAACKAKKDAKASASEVAGINAIFKDGPRSNGCGDTEKSDTLDRLMSALPPKLVGDNNFKDLKSHIKILPSKEFDDAFKKHLAVKKESTEDFKKYVETLKKRDVRGFASLKEKDDKFPTIYLDQETLEGAFIPVVMNTLVEFNIDGIAVSLGVLLQNFPDGKIKDTDGETKKFDVEEVKASLKFAEKFRDFRKKLAETTIAELSTKGMDDLLATYRTEYGVGDNAALGENPALQNFVLAELTDSYYCSPDTNQKYRDSKLAETAKIFNEFVKDLGEPLAWVK